MFRIFVCVHSNTPILQNQELLICRFGIDEVYYFNWFIIIFFIVFIFNGLATWAFIPASIAC